MSPKNQFFHGVDNMKLVGGYPWELKDGKLKYSVTVSQILIPEGHKITHEFIKNNLIDDKDLEDLSKLKYSSNQCPNLYKGIDVSTVFEKFLIKQSVTITSKDLDKKSLKFSSKDLKKLNKPRTKGAYGSIHFLQDYKFEDVDDDFKNSFVMKVQDRNFDFKDVISGTSERCFAFCELNRLQDRRATTYLYQTDLYQSHFYAPSSKDPTKYELYIIINKCKIILDDLIKKVHNLKPNHKYDKNYVPMKKFPVSVLVSLCKLFYDSEGFQHNDLKHARFVGQKNSCGARDPNSILPV